MAPMTVGLEVYGAMVTHTYIQMEFDQSSDPVTRKQQGQAEGAAVSPTLANTLALWRRMKRNEL